MIGRIHAHYAAGIAAVIALCSLGTAAHAQSASATTPAPANINVKSIVSKVYNAPQAARLPLEEQGSGAIDPHGVVIKTDGKERIFYSFTASRDMTAQGYTGRRAEQMQGRFGIVELSADGALTDVVPSTEYRWRRGQNQYRNFMKPFVAAAGATPTGDTRHIVTVISTEMNGNAAQLSDLTDRPQRQIQSNGNPQVVAIVQDARTGQVLKEYNLITMLLNSIGQANDQQQWGTPEIALVPNPDGSLPTGEQLMGVSFQRNNQTGWIGVIGVQPDGTIRAKSLLRVENQGQHLRSSVHVVPGSVTGNSVRFFSTHVRANNQPADIGIAVDLIDYNGGTGQGALQRTATKLIARSQIVSQDMRQNKYATQPTAAVFQGTNGPIFAVTYALSNPQRAQKQNGHSGGTNLTQIKTFDAALNELDYLNGIGPIIGGARHARGWETEYGQVDEAGKASPAIAVLAGSSIGAGAAGYNVVGLDPTTGKLTKTTRDKNFVIATNSDIAGLPTMGKANPQDQAGAFINMVRGSLTNSTTKYPEVTRWSVSFVQGPDKPESETRQHLYLSLVPRAWKPEVKVNPGGTATPSEVPSGPTPTEAPADVPIEQDPSTSPDQGGTDPVADEETSDDALAAYGRRGAKASSCSAAGPTSTPTGLAGFALLGLGLILAGKRRKNQKES